MAASAELRGVELDVGEAQLGLGHAAKAHVALQAHDLEPCRVQAVLGIAGQQEAADAELVAGFVDDLGEDEVQLRRGRRR